MCHGAGTAARRPESTVPIPTRAIVVVLLWGLLLPAFAEKAKVEGLRVYLDEGRYRVDADVRLVLTPGVREALHNGIALVFEVRAELKRENIMIPDSLVARHWRRYRLEYRPLLERYMVTELGGARTVETYLRLREALDAIGRIRGWPLIEERQLDRSHTYYVRVRGELLLTELPLPLQLHAYIKPSWWIATPWREVPLR
jgi:hypothetical protein